MLPFCRSFIADLLRHYNYGAAVLKHWEGDDHILSERPSNSNTCTPYIQNTCTNNWNRKNANIITRILSRSKEGTAAISQA